MDKAFFLETIYSLDRYLTKNVWLEPLLKTASELYQAPVAFSDYSLELVAEYHGDFPKNKRWSEFLCAKIHKADWIDDSFHSNIEKLSASNAVICHTENEFRYFIGSVIRNNINYGYFTVLRSKNTPMIQDAEMEIFKHICKIIAIRMSESDIIMLKNVQYGPTLRDLLEGKIENIEVLKLQMKKHNWNMKSHYRVFNVLADENYPTAPLEYIFRNFSKISKQIIPFEYKNEIYILIEAMSSSYIQNLCELLYVQIRSLNMKAGVSEIFHNIMELEKYRIQANRALILNPQNTDSSIFIYNDYKLKDLYTEIYIHFPYQQYYNSKVVLLKKYDETHSTHLSNTLHHYLKYEKSVKKCSASLNLHKNTVTGHLEKIKEILKTDFSDADENFHMLLTYEMIKNYGE